MSSDPAQPPPIMERQSQRDANQDGLPFPPGRLDSRYITTDAALHYAQYLQRLQSPDSSPGHIPAAPSRIRLFSQRRLPRLSSPIPRAPLSRAELFQRLQTVTTRLQTTPNPATSASTDEAENQCGICQDFLVGVGVDAPVAIKFNHCKHALHEGCMVDWLSWIQQNRGPVHQATCPHCRRLIFARETSADARRLEILVHARQVQSDESVARSLDHDDDTDEDDSSNDDPQ